VSPHVRQVTVSAAWRVSWQLIREAH